MDAEHRPLALHIRSWDGVKIISLIIHIISQEATTPIS